MAAQAASHYLAVLCLVFAPCLLRVTASTSGEGEVQVIYLLTNDTRDNFPAERAGFGPDFPDGGLEGRIMYADPIYACGKLNNQIPPSRDNYLWILLISRGGNCQFADKVINAQKHNFSAAIVHNDNKSIDCNSQLTIMGGVNGSSVRIPSVFVGCLDGMRLARDYTYKKDMNYIVKITAGSQIDYKMYLWPFAIVVAACFILVMVFLVIKFVRDHARQRMSRLSNRHLKKIPVRKFKKGDYYDTCAICLDEYEDGEKIRVLPCDHVYHTKCIDPWLTKNKKTCPVCKRRVIPGRDADSDSDSESDSGARGTSENTPLLGARAAVPSSGGAFGHSDSTQPGGGITSTQALLSGPGGQEDLDQSSQLMEESERQMAERQDRRRRRRRERDGAAREIDDRVGELEEEAAGVAGPSRGSRAGDGERETREQRRQRKEQKRRRRALRAERERAGRGGKKDEREDEEKKSLIQDEPSAPEADEEELGFVSAQSSFREEPALGVSADVVTSSSTQDVGQEGGEAGAEEAPLLGAVGGETEDYVNPSYSESQEVVVAKGPGKREMNQLV